MCEQLKNLSESVVSEPTQGFHVADQSLEGILEKICHNAWEKEVTARRGQHSVGWVFSQAANSYFVKPDANKIATEFDRDGDDEPVSNPDKLLTGRHGCRKRVVGTTVRKLRSHTSIENHSNLPLLYRRFKRGATRA